MTDSRPVLLLTDFYLPGTLAGGPIRSIANLVSQMRDQEFELVTSDHDLGQQPYPPQALCNVPLAANVRRHYLPVSQLGVWSPYQLHAIYRQTNPAWVYLNSAFSPRSTVPALLLRWLGLWHAPILLAPRGEFDPGALGLKSRKKEVFLHLARWAGWFSSVTFQASTSLEADNIRRLFPKAQVLTAVDAVAPAVGTAEQIIARRPKVLAGEPLRVAFVSRIAPKKNLAFALRVLSGVSQPCRFEIYGPQEDPDYWQECQQLIRSLPAHISVDVHGPLPHTEVADVLARAELFFLPTLGENFGHAIFEALSAGCPVLISDRTPWRHLDEVGVGADLDLDDPQNFADLIDQYGAETPTQRRTRQFRAAQFAEQYARDGAFIQQNKAMFAKMQQQS
jgi:glycosyltransferase involved in cell wall biosynthesis